MFRISKDTPAFYLTSVTNQRLPVFQKAELKDIVCKAIDEARKSCKFLLFAYVIMADPFHALVDSSSKPSKILQYINGITSKRVIDYLKANGFKSSLRKLQHAEWGRKYVHSLWDHHPNAKLITHEDVFLQKVNYIHQNPVRAGLVGDPLEYRWSSVRCWAKRPLENEPLLVDIKEIEWRR